MVRISIVEKLMVFAEKRCVRLTANYQELRRFITKDTDSYQTSFHFLVRKKITAKKKYCLFKIATAGPNLAWMARNYIFICEWAYSQRLIPVIDMEYQYNFDQGYIGVDNQWEYVFQQPLMAKDVEKQDYVIVKDEIASICYLEKTCIDINGKKDDSYFHLTEKNWREYYANINKYVKKYWIFKDEIRDEFEKKYGIRMKNAQNILGVFLRENFSEELYKEMNDAEKQIYNQHPRVPSIDETICIVKDYVKRWDCDYIFLATLYEESVEKFKNEFGNQIIVIDRKRKNREDIKDRIKLDAAVDEIYHKAKKMDMKEMGVSYAQEIIGLASCHYLLAAKGGGAVAALAINGGKYKDIHILQDVNNSVMY